MNVISSYKIKIVGINKVFADTERIYRDALAFFVDVINKEWQYISQAKSTNRFATTAVEQLTVVTKKRPNVKYDFSEKFNCFPCYLRRAAISAAYGIVSSYQSNHHNWVSSGMKGSEPKLKLKHHKMPTFFRGNTYKEGDSLNTAYLKLYRNNSWQWVLVSLRYQDVQYIQRYWSGVKESAPILEKHGKARFLRFAYTEKVDIPTVDITNQTVIAVDLGINNDAVCSAMLSNGTVIGRKFINSPIEKDRLTHALNKLKKHQRLHGSRNSARLWDKINRINSNIAKNTARGIMDFAIKYNADTVVFEFLDFDRKARGSKKQRLALWKKREIQHIVEHQAHRFGIRVSRICAWNTSRLAFDGSGLVTRGTYLQNGKEQYNYSICMFPNGKTYNCDLNASYNIGARYFIREINKSLPVTEASQIEAKDPLFVSRTRSTLTTLINLNVEISKLRAA